MKNKYLLLTAIIAVCLTGCTDYLDIKPKGKDVAEKIEHFDGMLNSTNMINLSYSVINEGSMTLLQANSYYFILSDEVDITAESVKEMNVLEERAYKWMRDIYTSEYYCAEWGSPYNQNYTLNVIINNVMNAIDGTQEQKKALFAEASVRRAFNYLFLAQLFAKPYNSATAASDLAVPIVNEANTTIREFQRATIQQVYDFVIQEMEDNCKYLPVETTFNLRMSRAAGYTLLGKTYFYKGDYQKALENLNIAFAAMKQSSQSVVGLFDYNVKMKEWGFNPEQPWAFAMANYPYPNRANYKESLYTIQASIPGSFYFYKPSTFVKDEYIAKYGPSDLRRNFFAKKSYTGIDEYPKYRKIQQTAINTCASVPDLYLMLAECEARVGSADKANEYLLELRKNRMPAADAPVPATVATKDDLVKFVIDERLREFMLSGYRWFDIRRLWNDPLFQYLKAGYTHSDGNGGIISLPEDRLVMAIPEKVMVLNTNWENNK
ncbi:MAG: RagB/SusD family nutrient uptake outer membrane protein [Bacteroidales bacterium]